MRVRAHQIDTVKYCGLPYYEPLGATLKITEHEIINHWFGVAAKAFPESDIASKFGSPLVMDARVAVMDSKEIGVNGSDSPDLFRQWADRNIDDARCPRKGCWKDGVEVSTRYGYIAEEICRNRTFFVTEAGRFGLGSFHISPGASIYLTHALELRLWSIVIAGWLFFEGNVMFMA